MNDYTIRRMREGDVYKYYFSWSQKNEYEDINCTHVVNSMKRLHKNWLGRVVIKDMKRPTHGQKKPVMWDEKKHKLVNIKQNIWPFMELPVEIADQFMEAVARAYIGDELWNEIQPRIKFNK